MVGENVDITLDVPGDRQDLALLDDQRSDQVFERRPLAKAVLIKK